MTVSSYSPTVDDLNSDIGQALEQLAHTQPGKPALHAPGRISLTYSHLGEQVRYVRHRLAGWEIARGSIVAGVIPERPELALACATITAGAAFAPLSPAFTTDVYAELLGRLQPKALVSTVGAEHPARIAARRCGVAEIALTADPSAPAGMFTLDLARDDKSRHEGRVLSSKIAYVLTTSGTTGMRKLVPLGDRQMILYARHANEWLQMSANDVGLNLQPMHLAGGLRTALLVSLLGGMSVVCLPEADVDALFAALDEYRPTWISMGFTVHRTLLRQALAHEQVLARCNLRFLRAVSGRLEPEEVERIEALFRAPVVVSLATSETFSVAMNPLPPRPRKRGSVGLPLCNEVAILGDDGSFCERGKTGEIVVRGPLVFDGYLDDPALNEASFTNGWFRTGDLGRFDEEGYLFLSGRATEVINRGGEKISPVEIDTVIGSLAGVQAAAVFGIPHRTLGEEMVAAVVRRDGATIEESDIIDRIRERMGPLRVPRRIYFVDELPRTDSGKIRRSELPRLLGLRQPDTASANEPHADESSASLSPLESALAGLWMSVLSTTRIERDDDFFVIGGDSLSGTRLLARVKAVFGVDLPIQALFQDAATLAGMAFAIEHARAHKREAARR